MDLRDDNYCFACGKDNPIGLKLDFELQEGKVFTEWTPKKEHQGWIDVIHGGIISTILDEAMARLLTDAGYPSVTSSMNIRFLRPAKVGETLSISAEIEKIDGKQITAASIIKNAKGKTVASSRGHYVRMNFSS